MHKPALVCDTSPLLYLGMLIPSIRGLVDAAHREGFRLTADVYAEALRLAGEAEHGASLS